MKAFSPAGMAVKGFYGYGAKTFGNPDGNVDGDGSAASTNDGVNPNIFGSTNNGTNPNIPPPLPVPTPPVGNTLTVTITADSTGGGQTLSGYLTAPQIADIQAGVYSTVVITSNASGAQPWWVITGDGGFGNTDGGDGFVIDVGPEVISKPIVYRIECVGLRFYGGGGGGGNQASNTPGNGGDAIVINDPAALSPMNVTLEFTGTGAGKVFGGGAGGGWTNVPANNFGGGGGAAGWSVGHGADGGHGGGVYDARNGGSDTLPPTPGSTAIGGANGLNAHPSGGNIASNGSGGLVNGTGGIAVRRVSAGVTNVIGGNASNLQGAVQ